MRGYRLGLLACSIAIFMALMGSASAQYWFQSGVRGSNNAAQNDGAGITIQTVDQQATNGSLGFWVGEDLSNGAFLQAGYEIPNASGYYPSACNLQGCSGDTYLTEGRPTWFWEYFPGDGQGSDSFLGGIGPDGSAGINGSFHTYSFESTGSNTWTFYFDNSSIGSIQLGALASGPNPPTAFGEYAQTNTNEYPMRPVTFKNMTFYMGSKQLLVPQGYSYIGYGKGSEEQLQNTYGVQEVGDRANYFQVGSGLSLASQSTLWSFGYSLNIASAYGNLTGAGNYNAYAMAGVAAPDYVNVSSGVREKFVGWRGSGDGSYTGNMTDADVQLFGNITETAVWQRQYYVNAGASYGAVSGSGWYNSGATARLSVNSTDVPTALGTRVAFAGWSTGTNATSIAIPVNGPVIVSTLWHTQYLVNATTEYGQVNGIGWYNANSTATISLTKTEVSTGPDTQLGFLNWSNGTKSSTLTFRVTGPLFLSALYAEQYRVTFAPENAYGQQLNGVNYYNVSSRMLNSSAFLFANRTYNIEYISYKGVNLSTNYIFSLTSPGTVAFKVPVYNITIKAASAFGTPLNAYLNVTFKNGTRVTGMMGKNGTASYYNVPYGYVSGSARYFGFTESISLSNGSDANLVFFTPSLLYVIIIGIAIVAAVGALAEREYKKKRRASAVAGS